MLQAAASSAETVRIVSNSTNMFVLLVYWTWWKTIRNNSKMEKRDARCLTYAQQWACCMLGEKCGQPPGMHALSGCDTVSYRFCKGMVSALKVLMNNDIDYLQDVLGYPDISQGQLKAMLPFSPSKVKRRPIS